MKPYIIDVTPEILEKYTADTSSVSNFQVKDTDIRSCITPNHLIGFPQQAVKMLELFSITKSGCDCKNIQVGSENIKLVTIKGNSDNTDIFNLFRNFGMVTGRLNIGISNTGSNPIIYTTSKTMKDISKFAPDVQAAMIFTLFSIAKVAIVVCTKLPDLQNIPLSGKIVSSLKLEDYTASFSSIKTIEVREMPSDGFSKITYFNNQYMPIIHSFAGQIHFDAILDKALDGTFSPKHSQLISSINFGTNIYPVIITENAEVYTNVELTTFETQNESYFTALATNFNTSKITVENKPLIEIQSYVGKDKLLVNLLDDESIFEEYITEAPYRLSKWATISKEANAAALTEQTRSAICKLFDVKTESSSTSLSIEEMKNLYFEDSYAQQLYLQIKEYYNDFDLGTLNDNLKGFSKGDLYSMLFIGDSGTGKSTAARVIPARCGIPYISINFSTNIEEADIFGTMIPNTTKKTPEDPEFIWQDGILTKAIRNGYCAVLEELNFARPGVLGKLNSLLDENRQIDLPTGEILKAHPNFRIIATCNIAYEGTNRFNKALVNRFDDCTIFKDIDRAKAIEIIKIRTGYKNTVKIDTIYNIYEALKKYGKEQNLNLIVSMRQLLNLFSKGKYYTNAKDAVCRIMLNGAFIEEPEYQEVFETTVLSTFKLNFKI